MLKKNIYYVILIIILITINILYFFNIIPSETIPYFSKVNSMVILTLSIIFEVILTIVIYFLNKKNAKIETIFLTILISIGLLFLISIPPGQIPDETTHFSRIYEISDGHFFSSNDGRDLPVETLDYMIEDSSDEDYKIIINNIFKKNSGEIKHHIFTTAGLYSFVCYLPQLIGLLIGRIVNMPILLNIYFCRLFGFITFALLMYLSIKYIPTMKELVAIIGLLPITLQQSVSLSPDALTIGVITFLISYTLYLAYIKEKVTNKDYLLLSVLCIFASLCKIVYMPACLILFIIPKNKFKSTKDKYIKIFGLALLTLSINMIWIKLASGLLTEVKEGVSPKEQLLYIVTHPFKYIRVIINSLFVFKNFYVTSLFGTKLQLFTSCFNDLYVIIVMILMLVYTYYNRIKNSIIRMNNKILLAFIFIIIFLLIFTSLYIQWTPLMNSYVEGVQGRYFLPILLLIPLLFTKSREKKNMINFEINNNYLFLVMTFFDICALIFIVSVHC